LGSAQNTWTSTIETTTTNNANVGIRTANPQANLHIHGNTIFSTPGYTDWNTGITYPGVSYGSTSRMLFTNATTGTGMYNGFEMRLSQNNMVMSNAQSNGTFTLSALNTPTLQFHSASQRVFLGSGATNQTWSNRASINIDHSSQNGLFVRANAQSSYGIRVHSMNTQNAFTISTGSLNSSTVTERFRVMGNGSMLINLQSDNENAIICYGSNQSMENFKVKGNGEVFARRIRVTLDQFPDYVFASNYRLMPLSELRSYINENNKLPNMPSAQEVEEEGADLGEINRLLVEKVEELTLYILQLERDMNNLSSQNMEKTQNYEELKNRLAQIETLLLNIQK
jgi:hypothetical protein